MVSNYTRSTYHNCLDMYTDVKSKDENDKVGIGVYILLMYVSIEERLPDQMSVYSAEMMAVTHYPKYEVRFC